MQGEGKCCGSEETSGEMAGVGQETAVDWKSSWHGAEAQVPNPT